MKKIIKNSLFIICLIISSLVSLQADAQGNDISLSTFVDGQANVCGDILEVNLEITNASIAFLDDVEFDIQLPSGIKYVQGSSRGMSEDNLNDLNNPFFTINSVPNSNRSTYSISYEVAIGCESIDFIQQAAITPDPNDGFLVANTTMSFTQNGGSITEVEEQGGSESFTVFYAELQLDFDQEDKLVQKAAIVFNETLLREFNVKNTGEGSTDILTVRIEKSQDYLLDSYELFLLNPVDDTRIKSIGISADTDNYVDFEFDGNDFPNSGAVQLFEEDEELRLQWSVGIDGCVEFIRNRVSAFWGCDDLQCNFNAESFYEPIIRIDQRDAPIIEGEYSYIQLGNECGTDQLIIRGTFNNSGANNDDPSLNAVYNLRFASSPNLISTQIGSGTISGVSAGNLVVINNLFTTDIDGAGGLSDQDGDGYFDDLAGGDELTIDFTFNAPSVLENVNINENDNAKFHSLTFQSMNLCEANDEFGNFQNGPTDASKNFASGNDIFSSVDAEIPVLEGEEEEEDVEVEILFQSIGRNVSFQNMTCSSPILISSIEFPIGLDDLDEDDNQYSIDDVVRVEYLVDGGSYVSVPFTNDGDRNIIIDQIDLTSSDDIIVSHQFKLFFGFQRCSATRLQLNSYFACDPSCSDSERLLLSEREVVVNDCFTCRNGVLDGDEEEIDCGGSCRECRSGGGSGGSSRCSLSLNELELTRTTFGWEVEEDSKPTFNDLYVNGFVPKVDENSFGIALDRAYPDDNIDLLATWEVGQSRWDMNPIQELKISYNGVNFITSRGGGQGEGDFGDSEERTLTPKLFELLEIDKVVIRDNDGTEQEYNVDLVSEPTYPSSGEIKFELNLLESGVPLTLGYLQEFELHAKIRTIDEINPNDFPEYRNRRDYEFLFGSEYEDEDRNFQITFENHPNTNVDICNDAELEFVYFIPGFNFSAIPVTNYVEEGLCDYQYQFIPDFFLISYQREFATNHFPNEFRPVFYLRNFDIEYIQEPEILMYPTDIISGGEFGNSNRISITPGRNSADTRDVFNIQSTFNPNDTYPISIDLQEPDFGSFNSFSFEEVLQIEPQCIGKVWSDSPFEDVFMSGDYEVAFNAWKDDPILHEVETRQATQNTGIDVRPDRGTNWLRIAVNGEEEQESFDEPAVFEYTFTPPNYLEYQEETIDKFYMSIELPQGTNLFIKSVKERNFLGNLIDVDGGSFYGPQETPAAHTLGKNFMVNIDYEGDEPDPKTFVIEVDYFGCDIQNGIEDLKVVAGYTCGGFPNVNSSTESVEDALSCDLRRYTLPLRVRLRLSNLQIAFDKLDDGQTPLCSPVEFEAFVASTRFAQVNDVAISANLPNGVLIDDTYTVQYMYPEGTAFQDMPADAFSQTGNQAVWDMTQVLPSGILPGANEPNHEIKLRYSLLNTCDLDPGIPIEFFVDGTSDCGGQIQLSEQRKFFIDGIFFDELTGIIREEPMINKCTRAGIIFLDIDNPLNDGTLTSTLIFNLPADVEYVSTVAGSGLPSPTVSVDNRVITYALPAEYIEAQSSATIGINVELSTDYDAPTNEIIVVGQGSYQGIQMDQTTSCSSETCALEATTLQGTFDIMADFEDTEPVIIRRLGGVNIFCEGDPIPGSVRGQFRASHTEYQWLRNGTPVEGYEEFQPRTSTFHALFPLTDVGSYSIRFKDDRGCIEETSAIVISYSDGSEFSMNDLNDKVTCTPSTFITSSGTYVDEYFWEFVSATNGGVATISNATNRNTSVTLTTPGQYVFRVTGTRCDIYTESKELTVDYINYVPNIVVSCESNVLTLTADVDPPGVYTYQWVSDNSGWLDDETNQTLIVDDEQDSYSVRIYTGNCTITGYMDEEEEDGLYFPIPTITTGPSDNIEPCPSDGVSVTLEVSSEENHSSVEWFRDHAGAITSIKNLSSEEDDAYFLDVDDIGIYYAEVTNIFGCAKTSNTEEVRFFTETVTATTGRLTQATCFPIVQLTGGGQYTTGNWSVENTPTGVASNEVLFSDVNDRFAEVTLPEEGEYTLSWNTFGVCANDYTASADIMINYSEGYYAALDYQFEGTYDEIENTLSICNGSSVNLSALWMTPDDQVFSGGFLSYVWSKNGITIEGATNSVFSTDEDGTFSVIISALGCERTAEVVIEFNEFAEDINIAVAGGETDFCPGSSVILSVDDSYDSYQWIRSLPDELIFIDGATNSSYTVTLPGSYSVRLTDENGCIDETAAVEMSYKESVTISISAIRGVTCLGAADGFATVGLMGAEGQDATYTLNSLAGMVMESGTINDSKDFSDLPLGTYTLTVTHPISGCETTRNFNIGNGSPFAQNILTTSLTCGAVADVDNPELIEDVRFTIVDPLPDGDSDFKYNIVGSLSGILASGDGVFGVVQQLIDINLPYNGETYTIELLADGATSNLCPESYEIIPSIASFSARIDESKSQLWVCGEDQLASVMLFANLNVSVLTTGDINNHTYQVFNSEDDVLVQDGQFSDSFHSIQLPQGDYNILLSSSEAAFSKCISGNLNISIQATDLNAQISTTDVSCPGGSNGIARALVSGGIPNYRYSWLDDSRTEVSTLSSAFGLAAGNYTLEVFDSRCDDPFSIPFTIEEPAPLGDLEFTLLPTNLSCDVEVTLNAAGGTAPYRFEWIRMEETVVVELDEFDNLVEMSGPIVEEVMFVDANVQPSGGVAISTTTSNIAKPGEYKIRLVDARKCEIESAIQIIEQPAVVREYRIGFKWKTRAESVEAEAPIVVSSASIASKSMGGQLRQAAEICVESSVAEFEMNFDALCMSGELLEDEVSLSYKINQYHYTLYYYDRAGNLTRTVPPKGVQFLMPGSLDRSIAPEHTLVTEYDYDNWGQLSRQESPDGGETFFAYNNQGQLRFYQNEKQLNEDHFSYTKYDRIGRTIEAGEADMGINVTSFIDLTDEILLAQDINNLSVDDQFPTPAENLHEQSKTLYTIPTGELYYGEEQTHLRNRISSVQFINEDGKKASTHYSYDAHSNLKWMIQDIPDLNKNYLGYDNDLISGNVKKVSFNVGTTAPFFHKYTYDDGNRLSSVSTSNNGYIWEEDATYDYFEFGPIKRVELGEDNVQGIDYAYTLNGWLKGINHGSLDPNVDPGLDGIGSSIVGRDAYGMELGYFEGDFVNEGSIYDAASPYHLSPASGKELFNGNISTWTNNILSPTTALQYDELTGYQYEYDELNRIKSSSLLPFVSGSFNATENYSSSYSYDPNGNLTSLTRNAYGVNTSERAMDDLTYNYDPANNQLLSVDDAVSTSPWLSDVEDQEDGNYTYDEIGNLIADVSGDIVEIDWTVHGKVNKIIHSNGDEVSFHYDAAGNRIRKQFVKNDGSIDDTYYVRDAGGNIMAVYEGDGTQTAIRELPIYGSDRLGQFRPSIQLVKMVNGTEDVVFDDGTSYLIDEPNDVVILGPGFTITEGTSFYSGPDPNDIPPASAGAPAPADATHVRVTGRKQYELKDHLGNVRAVVTDRKLVDIDFPTMSFTNYRPQVAHASFYYPFGMEQPGMNYNSNNYRYGFNGKEKDKEGEWGNLTNYDYGFRIYNPGIAKFLSVDPLTNEYPYYTPYQFAGNTPTVFIDIDGSEPEKVELFWRQKTVVRTKYGQLHGIFYEAEGRYGQGTIRVFKDESTGKYFWFNSSVHRYQEFKPIDVDPDDVRRVALISIGVPAAGIAAAVLMEAGGAYLIQQAIQRYGTKVVKEHLVEGARDAFLNYFIQVLQKGTGDVDYGDVLGSGLGGLISGNSKDVKLKGAAILADATVSALVDGFDEGKLVTILSGKDDGDILLDELIGVIAGIAGEAAEKKLPGFDSDVVRSTLKPILKSAIDSFGDNVADYLKNLKGDDDDG